MNAIPASLDVADFASKLVAVAEDVSRALTILGRAADDLSRRSRAAVFGAFGGSLVPTLTYIAINHSHLNTLGFFVLITMTGLCGGVALNGLIAGKSSGDDLQPNNAVFAELIERSQNPACSAEQKKLLLDQAMAISAQLATYEVGRLASLRNRSHQAKIAGPGGGDSEGVMILPPAGSPSDRPETDKSG